MNEKGIEYFLVTAEELNITRAAERLFITQQALSSHIKRLEADYHVQLFERKPTMRLTVAGVQMVEYCKEILISEKNIRARFFDINENCYAKIIIGMSRLRGMTFFPHLWAHYHPAHSNVSIELVDGNSSSLDELLQSGKIDLYIGIDAPESPNQLRIELARERIHCCVSRSLLEKYYPNDWQLRLERMKNGVDLTHIIDLPLLTLRKGNRLRNALDTYSSCQHNPLYIFECDQQELIYLLALQGEGVGLLSPAILYSKIQEIEINRDSFYIFPLQNNLRENSTYLVYRNDYPTPQYITDFIHTSCTVFQNYSNFVFG